MIRARGQAGCHWKTCGIELRLESLLSYLPHFKSSCYHACPCTIANVPATKKKQKVGAEGASYKKHIPRSGFAGSKVRSIFYSLRCLCTAFHSGCTCLHSHQQCRSAPFSPPPHQHLFLVGLMIAKQRAKGHEKMLNITIIREMQIEPQ